MKILARKVRMMNLQLPITMMIRKKCGWVNLFKENHKRENGYKLDTITNLSDELILEEDDIDEVQTS